MKKQEILNRVSELIDMIDSASEELKNISRELEKGDFYENEDYAYLQSELDDLNSEINNVKYRSEEFYELQEQIQEKESEIRELEKQLSEEEDNSFIEVEEFLNECENVAFDIWEMQHELYNKLNDFDY